MKKKSCGRIRKPPLRLNLAGKKITVVHDSHTVDFAKEDADIIVFGHSHKSEIFRLGSKVAINPGECGGWLTGRSSVALVDTEKLTVRIFKI